VAGSDGYAAVRGESARRWAWIGVVLGAWIVGGVYLVSRALNRGDATDAGISPYHVVAYTGLLVLVGLSLWLVVRAVRLGRPWRGAFPAGFGSLGAGAAVLVGYVVLDVAWREGVGIEQGIEQSFAPSRVILVVGLALVAMAPLRAALLADGPRGLGWPAAISAGLLVAAIIVPGGFNPIANPLLEKAPDAVEDNAEIWLMDAGGGRQTRLVEAAAGVEALLPAWSPDGSQIAYARFQGPPDDPEHSDYDIWVVNADGTGAHAVATGPTWQWLPRWSPDGSWIAYTDEAVGGPWLSSGPVGPAVGQGPQGPVFPAANAAGRPEADLWRMAPAGGAPTRITDAAGDDRSGSWSPDGRRLVFDSTRDGNTELYAVDADGSNSIRLTDNPAEDWAASWSPDGSQIAFTSNRTGIAQIWVMAADGSGQEQLTDDKIGALWPAWSPDGTRILFTGWATGGQQAWSMAADGTDLVNLSQSPLTTDSTWDGSWGPDGRIAFSRVGPSPVELSGFVREDFGAAAMLIGSLVLALVIALLTRTRPPFGSVALAMTISTAFVASQSDAWRFVPAAAIAGLAVDLLLRFLPPERRVAAAGAGAAVGLVAAVAGAVAATTGIGWSPTLLVGVGVAAALCGFAIGALIERHSFAGAPEAALDAPPAASSGEPPPADLDAAT
jgi:TolB protein